MGSRGNSRRNFRRARACRSQRDLIRLGFILTVFGVVTVCAFFLPLRAWIVLLGFLLIYAGYNLVK